MGLTVPLFETGGMIQMSGTSTIDWDEARSTSRFPGAKRVIEFAVDEVVELPSGSLPVRWSEQNKQALQLQVAEKIQESVDVTSFYLAPVPGDTPALPSFQPGQHLPITIGMGASGVVDRTYSLSANSTLQEYYRISVKRDPFGIGSTFLHDSLQVGDLLTVQKPAGDFFYDDSSTRTLVLLSSGIGVTPILSMLYKFVEGLGGSSQQAYWIHSATDGKHHPFQKEVERLGILAKGRLKAHITYTKPRKNDSGYDSTIRINAEVVKNIVPDLQNADIYLCGPTSFVADLINGLETTGGVLPSHIHFEDFST
jgi:ferredoxin-NADP reductase